MTDRLRIAWFAPNAGNWVTYRMEHQVANALADAGHEVTMIQCDRVLDAYCQVMAPRGLRADSDRRQKRAVCRECQEAAAVAGERARYSTRQLSGFLTPELISQADGVIEDVRPGTWQGIRIDGLPVGRYAAYTTMLHHKRGTVSETPEAWSEYLADLRGAARMALALPAIASELQPTHAFVYNALYPANRVFAEGLTARGSIVVSLSAGPTVPRRYETMALYDGIKASQTTVDSAAFRHSMTVPCSEQEVLVVEEHLHALMGSNDPWVYSVASQRRPASEIRTRLGIRPDAAVATVIVSSPDETRSNLLVEAEFHRDPQAGYASSAEFLEASVTLARARPDVDFVFRLHPRLAPNKRESLVSPDLKTIYRLLDDLPANAVVNHPSDGISLYDLVAISSAAVNHTSSAGLEFLVLGVPVLQYDPARAGIYPLSFSFAVPRHDDAEFAGQLERALAGGPSIDRSIGVFRWLASGQVRSVLHLRPLPGSDRSEEAPTPDAVAPLSHPLGKVVPSFVKEPMARRMQRQARAADLDAQVLPGGTTDRLQELLASCQGLTEVWEPAMAYPSDATEADELRAVRAAVGRLRVRLPIDDPAGLGVVAVDPASW